MLSGCQGVAMQLLRCRYAVLISNYGSGPSFKYGCHVLTIFSSTHINAAESHVCISNVVSLKKTLTLPSVMKHIKSHAFTAQSKLILQPCSLLELMCISFSIPAQS